ncbi:hypothetical protein Taro_033795 [Colocasia esculenta]|uniref:Glycosyltransferase 2-like domain-containing protein n=1 Tax=Colocasia esculenta TaxID=4460 RepID=A0A843W134_COLES|nr:hypothetical protein [Colocasia esculenta]
MVKSEYLAPPLQLLANICVVLYLIQNADHLVLCLGCFWIRTKQITPVPNLEASAGGEGGNIEAGALGLNKGYFPKVLVQIPMCNEIEVYQQSIAVVYNLDWSRSNILIQVLDDSDDAVTRAMIREEVGRWNHNGVNIVYRHRELRQGYKAGNLKSAMSCNYVRDYEFIWWAQDNEEVGLVQARWSFVNKDENLLTRLQYINLCFHFEVEQQVNGVFLNFFGFNGTAEEGCQEGLLLPPFRRHHRLPPGYLAC